MKLNAHTHTHTHTHMHNCVCETYLSFNSDILSKHKWDSEMFYSSFLLIISSHTLDILKISNISGIEGNKLKITAVLEHCAKNLPTCCVLSQQVHFSEK